MSTSITPIPSLYRSYETFLNTADPLIDPMVEKVLATKGMKGVNLLAWEISKWGAEVKADTLPADIYEFLMAPVEFPPWVEAKKLTQASKFYRRHGPIMISVLILAAFPECLFVPGFAFSLLDADTFEKRDAIHQSLARKTMGILVLFVLCAANDAFATSPTKGPATLAIQKLRIFHSIIRVHLRLNKKTQWDDSFGEPINQLNLAHMQVIFPLGVIAALQKLKLRLTKRDKQLILQTWNAIAWLLGVPESLIPPTFKKAKKLFVALAAVECRPSEYAKECMNQLFAIIKTILPFHLYKFVAGAMRFFLGNRLADMLGVPAAGWIVKSTYKMSQLMDQMADYFLDWIQGIFTAAGKMLTFPIEVAKAWRLPKRMERVRPPFVHPLHPYKPLARPLCIYRKSRKRRRRASIWFWRRTVRDIFWFWTLPVRVVR